MIKKPRRAAAAGAARTVGPLLPLSWPSSTVQTHFFKYEYFAIHLREDQGQRLPTLRGLPTRDTWVVPGHAAHQGLLTRSATNSYESTPRGSEGFGSPATAGCGQGAARVTPQATSPRARRPGCRARTARRGGAARRATCPLHICTRIGGISCGRLREEEELGGERHALDEDGRREAAAAWLGSG